MGDIVLLKEAAIELESWSIGNKFATNADKNGFVRSVKLILCVSGTSGMANRYLEQLVNKLVMLVENDAMMLQ